jgi:hypothetical protein
VDESDGDVLRGVELIVPGYGVILFTLVEIVVAFSYAFRVDQGNTRAVINDEHGMGPGSNKRVCAVNAWKVIFRLAEF